MAQETQVSTTATDARFVGRSASGLPTGITMQIGTLGYQDVANQAIMNATVVDRFTYFDHEVRTARGPVEGGSGTAVYNASAALIGNWHEVLLVYGGFVPRRSDIIDTLMQFDFEDSPYGMAVTPRSGTGLERYTETVSVVVEERGSITVFGRDNVPGGVPAHAGARTTAGGEIWRVMGQLPDREGTGANSYLYLIGTSTAFAEVVLDYRPVVDDRTLLEWLDSIDLAWA